MGAIETAQAVTAALNAQQWDALAGYLTDDFTFSGAQPQPGSKQEFIGGQRVWAAAVPDWNVALENLSADGDTVRGTSRITGTHTGILAFPGEPRVPATGKHFEATAATTFTMRGNQVAALHVVFDEPGILAQLGIPQQ